MSALQAQPLRDQFGRPAEKLRISITDRCNFRCTYCMPSSGMHWLARDQLLSYEEITRLTRIFVALGIRQLRLTGGEPTLRRDLPLLIAQLQDLGLEKISITTNGTRLHKMAPELWAAGLKSYNVSLDSLDPTRFAQSVRRKALDQVMAGLETLAAYPDCEVKINVVVIRNFNEDEALDFARLARKRNWSVRFIEFMPLGSDDDWSQKLVVPGQELQAAIDRVYPLELIQSAGHNPASRWRFRDGSPGELGFINSVSEPFCQDCNRIRLTSDGQLRTCLFALQENDLKAPLRQGASDAELAERIRQAVWQKAAGHLINQPGFQRPERTMSRIGG